MVQYTPASDKFVHKVSVDFKRRAVNEQIHVVQYDNSNMEFWLPLILGFLSSILASTGLWALIQNRLDRKDAKAKMLKGLGHDRIMDLGKKYIKRGYITPDEYENFVDYLYVPYEALHGNGSAKRIVEEVKRLPIRDTPINGKRSQKPKD